MREFIRSAMLLFLIVSTPVRSAPINTGVEDLLWPVIIVASPFIIVKNLIFGSDDGARRDSEKEATKILDGFNRKLKITGLNTGPLELQWALYGMLVESRIPLVEASTESIEWLISKSKDPSQLRTMAKQSKIVRLSLGSRSNPDCFPWKSDYYDFTKNVPVRPGTCLVATFANESKSNLRIEVNSVKVSRRELRWDVVDQSTNKAILSIPFWESQTEGKPLRVVPTYRARHETYPFVRLVQKLASSVPTEPSDANTQSYVMKWNDEINRYKEARIESANVSGEFRSIQLDWKQPDARLSNESWENGYQRAYSTGKPVVINNTLLINPNTNSVGPACANPLRNRCDFSKQFVSDSGTMTTVSDDAYEGYKSASSTIVSSHELSVLASHRTFDGEVSWHMRITPNAIPEQARVCTDYSNHCHFYVQDVRLTDTEFVALGRLTRGGSDLLNQQLELVVPRSNIPALVFNLPL